ncbi:MAG: Lon protease [Mycoplasmataceae bacterium]|nr:MAG: Lon protease [Mycoplasmataceae bacterium]
MYIATAATGGMAAAPLLGYSAAAGGLGFLIGDKADQEAIKREERLLDNEQLKDARKASDDQMKENQANRNLLAEIAGKLNGSIQRQPHETDDYLKQQLVVVQNNLKSGEERYKHLASETDKLRKQLGGSQSLATLLGLDKLSFTDKVIIAGGIIMVVYLLKG